MAALAGRKAVAWGCHLEIVGRSCLFCSEDVATAQGLDEAAAARLWRNLASAAESGAPRLSPGCGAGPAQHALPPARSLHARPTG